jgi:hypothetical protein
LSRGQADALAIYQPALLTVLVAVGAQVGRAGEDAGLDGSRRASHEGGGQQQEQGESKLSELQERSFPGHESFRPQRTRCAAGAETRRLAGIHLWRLNSDNYTHEGQMQAQIYNFLHKKP